LIPVLGKILEKLIINRINDFLHKNSKLNSKQFGFVPQKSTEEALHSVINFIQKGFEKKGFTLIISLDIAGAFNTCWWPQILNQLRLKSCPNNLLQMIRSYFTDRTSNLWYLNTETSRDLSIGCPQGSACGPSLWNISIDDIFDINTSEDIEIECFADDTIIKVFAKDITILEEKSNEILNKIKIWAENHKLIFNISKTNCVLFTKKLKFSKPKINFDGYTLDIKNSFKHLGLIIDNKLTWRMHANQIKAKAFQLTNNLLKISKTDYGLKPKALKTIY
jgi:hypothetical protein